MAWFIEDNIICWYGVPQEIISDNGSHFEGEVRTIMELYNIEHYMSSPYRPQTNGVVEVANNNIKNILSKMVVTYKDWAEKLPFVLGGYETSIHASTGQPLTLWSMVVKRCFPLKWRGTIFESTSGNQDPIPRRRLGETKIWAIGFDR